MLYKHLAVLIAPLRQDAIDTGVETGARFVQGPDGCFRRSTQLVAVEGRSTSVAFYPKAGSADVDRDARIYDAHFHAARLEPSEQDLRSMRAAGLGGLILFNGNEFRIIDNPDWSAQGQNNAMDLAYAYCNVRAAVRAEVTSVIPDIQEYWDEIKAQLEKDIDELNALLEQFCGQKKMGQPAYQLSVVSQMTRWLQGRGEDLRNFCLDDHQISHAIEHYLEEHHHLGGDRSRSLAEHIFWVMYNQTTYQDARREDPDFADAMLKAIQDAIDNQDFGGLGNQQSFMEALTAKLDGIGAKAKAEMEKLPSYQHKKSGGGQSGSSGSGGVVPGTQGVTRKAGQ
jgi:hypothetical protein